MDTGLRRYDEEKSGGTRGEEFGFAILQNRKADWPPRIVAREAARRLNVKNISRASAGGTNKIP